MVGTKLGTNSGFSESVESRMSDVAPEIRRVVVPRERMLLISSDRIRVTTVLATPSQGKNARRRPRFEDTAIVGQGGGKADSTRNPP